MVMEHTEGLGRRHGRAGTVQSKVREIAFATASPSLPLVYARVVVVLCFSLLSRTHTEPESPFLCQCGYQIAMEMDNFASGV